MENNEGCDKSARKGIEPHDLFHRAFYPLTLPLTVGPGSISVAITLGANAARRHTLHSLTILTALVGFALIAFSIFLCYGFADRLARTLGRNAMTVITKLSSFLSRLYWRANQREWHQGLARVCDPAYFLTGRIGSYMNEHPSTTQFDHLQAVYFGATGSQGCADYELVFCPASV